MNKNKLIKIIFLIVILSFIVSYIIEKSGYYEYKLQNKKIMTEENIKKFEADVKEGKNVDIEDYMVETEIDYRNKLTRETTKISNKVNNYLKKGIEKIFNILNNLVEE